jgi:hypothetical protein
VKLKAWVLWRAIDVGGEDQQKQMMALDALCSAVPPEMVTAIADTVKAAWATIATMRIGDGRVKKNTA